MFLHDFAYILPVQNEEGCSLGVFYCFIECHNSTVTPRAFLFQSGLRVLWVLGGKCGDLRFEIVYFCIESILHIVILVVNMDIILLIFSRVKSFFDKIKERIYYPLPCFSYLWRGFLRFFKFLWFLIRGFLKVRRIYWFVCITPPLVYGATVFLVTYLRWKASQRSCISRASSTISVFSKASSSISHSLLRNSNMNFPFHLPYHPYICSIMIIF